MATTKPLFKRLITVRLLRFYAMRFVAAILPPLSRRLNFYTRVLSPDSVSSQVLVNTRFQDSARFSKYEEEYLSRYCDMDRVFIENDISGSTTINLAIVNVPDCEVLGHTGSTVKPDLSAILSWKEKSGDVMGFPAWNVAKPKRLKSVGVIDGNCVSLLGFDRGHRHYYHFLIDSFLPLCVYLLDYHPAGKPLTVLVRSDLALFQKNVLAFLQNRFPQVSYRVVHRDEKVTVRQLTIIRYTAMNRYRTFSNDRAIQLIRELYFTGYGINEQECRPTDLLYIGRREVKQRNLINEDEIMAALAPLGFRKIEPGGMPHAEQVRTFANARIIVAAHGTALTNVLFCMPGASVIEISPANLVQSVFFWMTRKMGLGYDYLIGSRGDLQQNFTADVTALKQKVETLLSGQRI